VGLILPQRRQWHRQYFPSRCATVSAMENLGLYVQVPFCQTKSPTATSHTGVCLCPSPPYIDAVQAEISQGSSFFPRPGILWPAGAAQQTQVDTVYMVRHASLLNPELLAALLRPFSILSMFLGKKSLSSGPETIEPEKALQWVAAVSTASVWARNPLGRCGAEAAGPHSPQR